MSDLRDVMRRFPHGVAVLTVDAEGERLGLTVASLVSLSLEPPLVGVAVSRQAAMHELLRRAGGFALSLLAEGQDWLAQHFARGVPPIAMWDGIETSGEGAPLLDGAPRVDRVPAGRRGRDRRPHSLRRRGALGRAGDERGAAPPRRAGVPVAVTSRRSSSTSTAC